MPINATWHRAHRMPKRPTTEQRLDWHREHARMCQCREVPPALQALMDEAEQAHRTGKGLAAKPAAPRPKAAQPRPRKRTRTAS
jgi:hypothetical protein